MEREEGAAKVGAGGTAASGAPRKPLLQAVRDGDFKAPDGGRKHTEKDVSEWLFDTWESAIKRDRDSIADERAVRKARLEVFLDLFKQVDVSFDGHRIKFFGGPLIDAYKSLRAIHELSPHVVECFFKDHDLAALSVCVETVTAATGELHATFNPSVALVEFIAAHRADNGD